jgi:hypothetical protein
VIDAISNFLTSGPIDEFVASHDYAWPLGEILHFFGMALLIGSVGLVDARMLGIAKGIPIKSLEKFIPLGVIGFIINVLTGIMFVAGNPVGGPQEYLTNLAFLLKMLCVLIAGLNLLAFYALGIAKKANAVEPGGDAPTSAKVVAVVSLLLWFGVIYFGRFIMYNDTLLYAWGL